MARGARERARRRRRGLGDRRRRAGRGHRGEARRARLPARRRGRGRARPAARLPGRPRDDPRCARRWRRCTSCADLSRSRDRHGTRPALAWRAVNGSGSSARSSCPTRRRASSPPGQLGSTLPAGTARPAENLHVTLAFLGSPPAGEVPAIVGELRAAAAAAGPAELRPLRYRETRSVGMIVCEDVGGAATALADDLERAARAARRLPPRGAAVAPARHRSALPRAGRRLARRWRTCVRFMSSGRLSTVPRSAARSVERGTTHSKRQP